MTGRTGVVYFAQAIGTGFVKIGYSADVRGRIKSLETGCPHDIRVIKTLVGTTQQETDVQFLLRPWHHKREWFDFSDEAIKIIKKLSGENPVLAVRGSQSDLLKTLDPRRLHALLEVGDVVSHCE